MKKYQVLKWVVLGIAIAINVFIIVNSFITGEMSAKESNRIAHTTADVINTVKPETITEKNFDKFAFNIRKLYGHFGLCAISGGFSTWAIYLFTKDKKILDSFVEFVGNKTDYQGEGILHYGAKFASAETVKQLVSKDLDRNLRNISGETPADIAIRWGRSEIANLLR